MMMIDVFSLDPSWGFYVYEHLLFMFHGLRLNLM